MASRNIRTAHHPDGKRVGSGRPPELRCFWKAVTEDRLDEANFRPDGPQLESNFEQI